MVKQRILEDLKRLVEHLGFPPTDPVLSIPSSPQFGDYTTNIALQLAKLRPENSQHSAIEIANSLVGKLQSVSVSKDIDKVEIAGPGFINFFINPGSLTEDLKEIIKNPKEFGKNELGKNQKAQVEFISANPTGPLTLANGRGGAIGDAIANVLASSGYRVNREYYVNDTGNQVRLLGGSVLAAAGKIESEDEHYKGEYIKELAARFKDKLDLEPFELGHVLADYLLEHEIKPAVARMGINFDKYYSERSLYEGGLIEKAIEQLSMADLTYEQDGALWFKASQFGDDEDRVLVTSRTQRGKEAYTYVVPDIAHHIDDLSQGYVRRINILGADHHGYIKRLNAALEALGLKDRTEVVFMQMVKLFTGSQEVRMSKRAGTFVTLNELLDQVSTDVARFFFLMFSADSPINFDLDLAKEQSNKNPVYYVQYAHTRMWGILEKAGSHPEEADLEKLTERAEIELIKHLSEFPDLIKDVALSLKIHRLTGYAIQLADKSHRFYESCPVLNASSDDLKRARLVVVRSSQIILQNSLSLLGISAPNKM